MAAAAADCRRLLLYVAVLPGLLERLVGLALLVKLLVSAGLLVPLGFAMGMPFPTGLRALCRLRRAPAGRDGDGNLVEWAWAMNAASSVLGSVLAIVIAIQFGLNVTLACGAGGLTCWQHCVSELQRRLRPLHSQSRHETSDVSLRSAMILG